MIYDVVAHIYLQALVMTMKSWQGWWAGLQLCSGESLLTLYTRAHNY